MNNPTHLSRHFEQRRFATGLKPGQLARLAGCSNPSRSGSRIRRFELTGKVSQVLFEKLVAALQIDAATIEKLVEQDRREFFQAWLAWVNEPIQPHLVIRIIAAVYVTHEVPPHITTMEQAETWAASVAKEKNKRCCLVWSRRISSWFCEDGTPMDRTEAVPGQPNCPWLKVGGSTFLFNDDLSATNPVEWPKKPGTR